MTADDSGGENTTVAVGRLLSLLVHDLRNPAATIGANVGFIRQVDLDNPSDVDEMAGAFADTEEALGELLRGLEAVALLGQSLAGELPAHDADGDVGEAMKVAAQRARGVTVDVERPVESLRARGSGTLAKVLDLMLANAALYAPRSSVRLCAYQEGDRVVVEHRDKGKAVDPSLREAIFRMSAQPLIKARAEGRYGRFAGWIVARILAESVGATIEADGIDGDAIFRVRLSRSA